MGPIARVTFPAGPGGGLQNRFHRSRYRCIYRHILLYIIAGYTFLEPQVGEKIVASGKRSKGRSNTKLLQLPPDLALDLEAFCEAHYGAPAAEVIRNALREFIDSELKAEPKLRTRFLAARVRLGQKPRDIRVIDGGKPE
jgi:hypothetical protein